MACRRFWEDDKGIESIVTEYTTLLYVLPSSQGYIIQWFVFEANLRSNFFFGAEMR